MFAPLILYWFIFFFEMHNGKCDCYCAYLTKPKAATTTTKNWRKEEKNVTMLYELSKNGCRLFVRHALHCWMKKREKKQDSKIAGTRICQFRFEQWPKKCTLTWKPSEKKMLWITCKQNHYCLYVCRVIVPFWLWFCTYQSCFNTYVYTTIHL